LRVSLPLNGAVLMPALSAFMRAYPDVQLDLAFSDRLVDVIDEGFDAVVRVGEVADSRLMSRVLGEFQLKLVASPDYLARRGVPSTPDDLASHACLHHRFATSGKLERWPLRWRGKDIDIALPSAAVANTIEPLIYMAEHGLGIACLQDSVVRRQIDRGHLNSVLDKYVAHVGRFRLLWPSSRYPSPKLRVFIEFMADHLFATAPAMTSDIRRTEKRRS
jgi:DNA-binding transcriptional LysR family regulator